MLLRRTCRGLILLMTKLQRGFIPKTIAKNFVPIIILLLSAKRNDVLGIKLLLKSKK